MNRNYTPHPTPGTTIAEARKMAAQPSYEHGVKFGPNKEFAKDPGAPAQTSVLEFTTHELAELYVILSGNHDIPEVYLNKVAAALKGAL